MTCLIRTIRTDSGKLIANFHTKSNCYSIFRIDHNEFILQTEVSDLENQHKVLKNQNKHGHDIGMIL